MAQILFSQGKKRPVPVPILSLYDPLTNLKVFFQFKYFHQFPLKLKFIVTDCAWLYYDSGFVQGKNDSTIYGLISGGISYLDSRTEFWRQQKPLYARKKEKPVLHRNKPKPKTEDPTEFIVRSLDEIDQKLSDGDEQGSLKQAESTLRTVKAMNDKAIPNKQEVIANLHSSIGNALLEMDEPAKALENHKKDLNISKKMYVNCILM